jgi:hypothetical protein
MIVNEGSVSIPERTLNLDSKDSPLQRPTLQCSLGKESLLNMKIVRNVRTFYCQKADFLCAKHVVCSVNTVFEGLH